MACVDFCKRNDCSKSTIDALQNDIFTEGVGCINANQASCSDVCKDLTKYQDACFSCLGQSTSCPGQNCINQPTNCNAPGAAESGCCPQSSIQAGCCVNAKSAVECGTCVAARGGGAQTLEDFQACLKPGGLSHTNTIIIAVCTIVGVLIIISAVVISIRLKKSSGARSKLLTRLRKDNINSGIIHDIGDLNYSRINSNVFKDVNENLALKRASSRIKQANLPPPQNVQMTQLASSTDGLFAL